MINKSLEITPEAENDICAIAAKIQLHFNHDAALLAVSEFKNQLNTLSRISNFGRAGICEQTREVVMRGLPYIAVYENRDDAVTIVRVLDGTDSNISNVSA